MPAQEPVVDHPEAGIGPTTEDDGEGWHAWRQRRNEGNQTLLDDDNKPVRYQIVGPYEADARSGRISYNSPLGRALIGRRVEDEIEVTVPSGDRFYVVEKIEFI